MLLDGLNLRIGREGADRDRSAAARVSTMTGFAGRALIDRKIWRREGMIGVRADHVRDRSPVAQRLQVHRPFGLALRRLPFLIAGRWAHPSGEGIDCR